MARASHIRTLLVCLLLAGISTASADTNAVAGGGFTARLEARTYNDGVSGDTSESVLVNGTFHEDRLLLGYRKSEGGLRLEGAMDVRGTNDRRVDEKAVAIKSFSLSVRDAGDTAGVIGGYGYAELSPYLMSRGVLGFIGKLRLGKILLEPVYGQTVEAKENAAYQRLTQGGRVEIALAGNLRVNGGYLLTGDRASSISADSLIPQRESGRVWSAGAAWERGPWKAEGEYADSSWEDKKAAVQKDGAAWRARGSFSRKGWRAQAEHERVGTDFVTLSGWAVADRETSKAKTGWAGSWLGFEGAYENMSNNLNRSLPNTETIRTPQGSATISLGRWAEAQGLYKVRFISTDDAPRTVDRRLTTASGGFLMRLGAWRPAVMLERNRNVDRTAASGSYANINADVSLRTAFESKDSAWRVQPQVGWRWTRETYDLTRQADVSTSWPARVNAQYGDRFELNGTVYLMDSDRPSTATESKRKSWDAEAVWKIRGRADQSLSAAYRNNRIERSGSAGDTAYTERTVEASLRLKYR